MAVIHCLGAGLVGSYVAKRLAGAGHEVHVYDWQPHRVMGVAGIHVHPEDATDAVGGMSRNGVVDMVVNMLPGSIGHVASTYLAESSYRIVDLSFSKF
ncbi:MAG: hypothetical protein ABGX06_04265, partial [Candidatus Poseidoniia archaeon]